jgi:deoxyadenosine/deoxycytidine kinase
MFSSNTQQRRRPYILSIEGNIGAGKSTLLHHMKTQWANSGWNVVFMQEPVDIWNTVRDEDGNTILEKYYNDPTKYSFSFQIMAYSTRLAMLQNTIRDHPECDVLICERSLEADCNIFADMLFDDKCMEHVNHQIYKLLYNNTAKQYAVDGIVYLDATPETCLERIHVRNRGGESKIGLDYLAQCSHYYNKWLVDGTNEFPLLQLDTNQTATYQDRSDVGFQWIQQIEEFMERVCQRNRLSKPASVYGGWTDADLYYS